MLLAAGSATRLGDLAREIPKPMRVERGCLLKFGDGVGGIAPFAKTFRHPQERFGHRLRRGSGRRDRRP